MIQRCAHKGFRHPFFPHSAALAITSPSLQSVFPKGGPVLVTSALSDPTEGRRHHGGGNLPRIRSSVMPPPAIVFAMWFAWRSLSGTTSHFFGTESAAPHAAPLLKSISSYLTLGVSPSFFARSFKVSSWVISP